MRAGKFIHALAILAGAILSAALASAATGVQDWTVRTLAENGLKPSTQSLAEYFRSILPGEQSRKELAELAATLGADAFADREQATQRLASLPFLSPDGLRQFARGGTPEVRLRVEQILAERQSGDPGTPLLHAVMRTIAGQPVRGLAEAVVQSAPLCGQHYLMAAACEAAWATARPEDAPALRAVIAGDSQAARAAAIHALAGALGDGGAAELRALLGHPDDQAKCAAAWALARAGDRACLPVLGQLLESRHAAVRQSASAVLRALTGQPLPYSALDEPGAQSQAIADWRRWIAAEGDSARLHLPLKLGPPFLGRVLICESQNSRVIELDASGKEVFRAEVQYPWGCQGLPNGHRLVASHQTSAVIEFDGAGKECWRKAGLPAGPMSVQRLENGNTLISCSTANKVIEVNRAGEVVWELSFPSTVADARRLENGRTLVCVKMANCVVEVDRTGKEFWRIEGLKDPVAARRLDNGNTLIAQAARGTDGEGRVTEHEPSGREVWSSGSYTNPWDAQRLPSGLTLIGDRAGVREVDRAGKTVWEYKGNYCRAVRY